MVRLDWLRRETYGDHPDNHPWVEGEAQGDRDAADDALQAQEDYEYHVALALSQSADEERLALAKEEADNIESVRQRSLAPLASGRSTGAADCLSYKLWDSDCLNYDDNICDGVYDVRGDFPELCIGGSGACFPTLPDLKSLQPARNDPREVVVVDHDQDPGLCAVDERAADAIAACIKDGPLACIQALAQVVANQLGGRCTYAELSQRYASASAALKAKTGSLCMPIGTLSVGLARHRSLLFKSLADASELPCRLLRGRYYLGAAGATGDAAIVMVKISGREMMVDLVADPGTVYPVVPDSIPQANPPTSTSSPSLGTPAGLDGFDGDMEGPDLIPIKEDETGSGREWTPDATPLHNGFPHTSSGMDIRPRSSRSRSSGSSPRDIPGRPLGAAAEEQSPPRALTSWVNTGLSSPSPFEASGLQSEAWQVQEPRSSNSMASTTHADSIIPPSDPAPEPHVFVPRVPSQTTSPVYHLSESLPKLMAGRGAESAFHSFGQSPANGDAHSIITQAVNGVRRRPPLPRHSISDLTPTSLNRIASVEAPVAPIPEHTQPWSPGGQMTLPQSFREQASLHHASTAAGQPQPADAQDPHWHLEPMRNAPPSSSHPSEEERALSHQHASTSEIAPFLGKVSPAAKLSEVAAIPNVPSGDLAAMQRESLRGELDEWEIDADEIELGPRIGIGSYGEVYRGIWRHTDVAVKRLLEQDLTDQLMEEFRAEVSIMKRLKHPNIVLFMGACTQAPNRSIVTQFVPRGSLFRLLHRTPQIPLDERRKVRMALDVAKGMNYLHSCRPPIVHRDLKSPNLLVDKDFTVKVCDFGLSRVRRSTWMSNKSQAGTPEWTAPEVLRSQFYNEKSDVYSMGVILWELLTNEEPWGDKSAMQVVGAVGWGNASLPIPDDAPEVMRNLILQCWADPAQRPSFSDIIRVLNKLDH